MLAELFDAAKDAFGNLGSPLHDVARAVQAEFTNQTPPQDRAGSKTATTRGHKADGPKPQAAELRDTKLAVPGEIDHERARADADRALAAIDFSRPELVLWVPATNSHSIPEDWQRGVEQAFGQRASSSIIDYPANANFNDSVSTGMETVKLVLAGIAERGGHHRVTLGGHSQGAWVIGDAIADPAVGASVDKATLYGHPAPAKVDWEDSDPNVRQVDDPNDPFVWDVAGGQQALTALDDIHDGQTDSGRQLGIGDYLAKGAGLLSTALQNPALSAYLIGKHVISEKYDKNHDPHNYRAQYADGATFLAA
ncbi:MAG: hypothetical protein JWL76_412 [Thermoleophilia bacterium]|nr:hypothetical protein [Thermoleophilia bacterium]